jgi:inositol-hexakisphosphate/diphosphoinositol-pentakisphosphate 1-kinase
LISFPPGYFHGEARKAPTVDGKVQRSKDGKEIRYPIILSTIEKQIAQTIVEAFGQVVCGFDILRTKGFFPVVCDVNGWSFVKGNQKYYDDCAALIRSYFYDVS